MGTCGSCDSISCAKNFKIRSVDNLQQEYDYIDIIGTGGFGKVLKVQRKMEPEKMFAMKEYSKILII